MRVRTYYRYLVASNNSDAATCGDIRLSHLETSFPPVSPFRRFLSRVDVFHHVEPALSV